MFTSDKLQIFLLFIWAMAALGYEIQQIFYSSHGEKFIWAMAEGARKQVQEGEFPFLKERFSVANSIQVFLVYLQRDLFNIMDLIALILTVFSLGFSMVVISRDDRDAMVAGELEELAAELSLLMFVDDSSVLTIWYQNIGAVGILLMWIRQLRLFTIVSSEMAVLIRMMMGMIGDVVRFLLLLVIVLTGFASALSTIYVCLATVEPTTRGHAR